MAIRKVKELIARLDEGATVSKLSAQGPWVITDTNEEVSPVSVNALAKRAVVIGRDLCGDPMQFGGPVATQDRTGD